MRGQAGFFDVDERLKELSAKGDTLERLKGVVDFEVRFSGRTWRERCPARIAPVAVVLPSTTC